MASTIRSNTVQSIHLKIDGHMIDVDDVTFYLALDWQIATCHQLSHLNSPLSPHHGSTAVYSAKAS